MPLAVPVQDVRQQGLHVLAVDASLGSHVRLLPLFVQQVHQDRRKTHVENTLCDRMESTKSLFQVWRRGFVEKNQSQDTLSLWGSTLSLEPLCEPMGDVVHRLHGQSLHHLGHQAVPCAVCLVLHHFPTCTEDSVDSNNDLANTSSNRTVSSASLVSNPLRPHLRGLILVIVASFAVGPNLLHPFFSVFTGTSRDPEFLHNWSSAQYFL